MQPSTSPSLSFGQLSPSRAEGLKEDCTYISSDSSAGNSICAGTGSSTDVSTETSTEASTDASTSIESGFEIKSFLQNQNQNQNHYSGVLSCLANPSSREPSNNALDNARYTNQY